MKKSLTQIKFRS